MSSILIIIILVVSLCGFLVSSYIHIQKKEEKPMVCPLKGSCEDVTSGKYSKFLGFSLENIGIAYYLFIFVYYGLVLSSKVAIPNVITFVLVGFSIGAFIFSAYLTMLQGVVVKKWCTWCLCSAFLSTVIAVLSVLLVDFDIREILLHYKPVIIFIHALAAAIGLGSVVVTDVSFMKYISDGRIDKMESDSLKMYSQIIWVALGLLILTGVGLYLPAAESLGLSSKFLLKAVLVVLVTVNGIALNYVLTPKITKINFKEKDSKGNFHSLRKVAYASGGFSLVTWFLIFFLGSIRSLPLTFSELVVGYIILIVFVVIGSQVYEKKKTNKLSRG